MKIQLIILSLFSFILLSIAIEKDNFKIIGKAHGFTDSTVLYLEDAERSIYIDSTYIINESFIFKGHVSEPKQYVIQTRYQTNKIPHVQYKFLWVTDTRISFDGTYGDFWFAKIKGGQIHKEQNELDAAHYVNNRSLHKIFAIYDTIDKKNHEKLKELSILQDSLRKTDTKIDIEFIKQHPNYFISIYVLDYYKQMWGKELTNQLFSLLSEEIKRNKYGDRINKYLGIK